MRSCAPFTAGIAGQGGAVTSRRNQQPLSLEAVETEKCDEDGDEDTRILIMLWLLQMA